MEARLARCLLIMGSAFLWSCASNSALQEARDPEPGQTMNGINTEYLCQHWFHSPEEQKTDFDQIYRTGDHAFPPSRFRMQYVFRKNGDCEWYYLSPDDAHRFRPGRWKIESGGKHILEIVKEETTERYKVTELSKNVLRMTMIAPADPN